MKSGNLEIRLINLQGQLIRHKAEFTQYRKIIGRPLNVTFSLLRRHSGNRLAQMEL